MSNHSRGGAAVRMTSVTTRERAFAVSTPAEEYVAHSPSLAAGPFVADDAHALSDHRAIVAARPRSARAAWLLVVWFGLSVATIAAAAGVIVKYF